MLRLLMNLAADRPSWAGAEIRALAAIDSGLESDGTGSHY
jgi:hypothetical protein